MGVFDYKKISLDAGEKTSITAPSGTSGINKIYITSSNLSHAVVKTDNYQNVVPKSVNLNYAEGFYPLKQSASSIEITVFGMDSAETVTIIAEWI